MLRIDVAEIQSNFENYLRMSQDQEIIITRNGQDAARLSGLKPYSAHAPARGYGLLQASYEEFLELTKEESLERWEYIDGEIFLQESPTIRHQLVSGELLGAFSEYFAGKKCMPMIAPLDIIISRREGDINVVQPDLMVICDLEEKLGRDGHYYGTPSLTVEILAEDTKTNDLVNKVGLYKDGGVKEYWIADPEQKQVIVYRFEHGNIVETAVFTAPQKAPSTLFPELEINLAKVFRQWPSGQIPTTSRKPGRQ